jgi:hypothetical protein
MALIWRYLARGTCPAGAAVEVLDGFWIIDVRFVPR